MKPVLSKLSRRKLLMATGLSGASLFLPSLLGRGSRVLGQAAPPIKRLVIMTMDHGVVRNTWRMMRKNADYGNWEYNFDDPDPMSFSETLRPLHPNRSNLLVLEGISQASALGDRAVNGHNMGHLHLLTGAKSLDDNNSGGPSVDQIISKAVARSDRIPSLEMAAGGQPFMGGFVNAGPSMRMPVEIDPGVVFQRLFPSGNTPSQKPSERELINAARGTVLDFVHGEYDMIAPKLSSADKTKLDMHRDMIRDLEMRVASLANLKCGAPPTPQNTDRLVATKAYADLTAAAFACDLTRVATIQITQLANSEFNAPPGDVHQDFAHRIYDDANAAKYMTQYSAVHAQLFGYLIDALKRYPDGNGTLLDSTAAVLMTELANGPHELDKIPIVLAGSCGGYFRMGRYLSWAQTLANPHEHPEWGDIATRPIGPGHSHFLISLMQAMGLSQNQIGDKSVVTRDGKNTTLNLTGPLDRLT